MSWSAKSDRFGSESPANHFRWWTSPEVQCVLTIRTGACPTEFWVENSLILLSSTYDSTGLLRFSTTNSQFASFSRWPGVSKWMDHYSSAWLICLHSDFPQPRAIRLQGLLTFTMSVRMSPPPRLHLSNSPSQRRHDENQSFEAVPLCHWQNEHLKMQQSPKNRTLTPILLMEEILHHLGCIKPLK